LQVIDKTEQNISESLPVGGIISHEDELRAQIYRLLAGFLSSPPDDSALKKASNIEGDNSEIGKSLGNFAKIAGQIGEQSVDTEFHDLFIGVTRGELLPFGSYYQTGFLNEKPLATLRADMASLGIARVDDLKEPED